MAVRLKITLLFTAIMAFLLAVLCGCVYYFSYFSRLENIKAHLTNRALITSGMLHQPGVFNDKLMSKIDATLVRSIKNKSIQVYNDANEKLYGFSDTPAFFPSARIACRERSRWGPASACTVIMSAPASAKAAR